MKKVIQIFLLIILSKNFCFSQEINKTYSAKVDYKNSGIFEKYDLVFNHDNTFKFSRHNYQVCYSDYDTINGFWIKSDNKIHFYNIDNKNFISKANSNLAKNEIIIKETCVSSYECKDKEDIFIVVLNANFCAIEILQSKNYIYNEKNKLLNTSFIIPENSAHLIYVRKYANTKIINDLQKLNYFDSGIELTNFENFNTFHIENCNKNDFPQIMNPSFTLLINKDGTLISEKEFYEMDGKPRYRKFTLQK